MNPAPLSDVALGRAVADVVSQPRRDRADSFVLHAPLELLARLALLPHVRPEHREAARARISDIATKLDAFGPGVDPPAVATFASPDEAAARLLAAVDRGDPDDADAAASWLGPNVRPDELAMLIGDAVIARLAAAGHAPIFLAHWPPVNPRGEVPGALLRPLARALAERPELRIGWMDRRPAPSAPSAGARTMFEVLAEAPHLGAPDVGFIAPIMGRVDVDAVAELLGPVVAATSGRPVTMLEASRDVLRAAAWSMLLEPGEHAPYLWSHCLTMPQAVLAIGRFAGDPVRNLAVAATHVVGFRSGYATHALDARFDDPAPELGLADAIDAGQRTAAAAAWHTRPVDRARLIDELVNRAAVHEDAHLVKYTLACLDAAAADPAAARVYVAAAASLSGWWATDGR